MRRSALTESAVKNEPSIHHIIMQNIQQIFHCFSKRHSTFTPAMTAPYVPTHHIRRHALTSSNCDRYVRSAKCMSTDRVKKFDYRPIPISGRSIGASLIYTVFPTHRLYLGGPPRYINGRPSIFGDIFVISYTFFFFLSFFFIHPR